MNAYLNNKIAETMIPPAIPIIEIDPTKEMKDKLKNIIDTSEVMIHTLFDIQEQIKHQNITTIFTDGSLFNPLYTKYMGMGIV